MTVDILLHILFRFIHIGSVILFIGGMAFAGFVFLPGIQGSVSALNAVTNIQRRFRGSLYTLIGLIFISGLYNYLTYAGPRHSSTYQIWFGIKFLLFLHVLSSAILWATTVAVDTAAITKSRKRLVSAAISGFAIVLISAYLRSLSQRGL